VNYHRVKKICSFLDEKEIQKSTKRNKNIFKLNFRFIEFFINFETPLQADGSKKTGCFDLTCPGFIQTNNEIALGAAIYPIPVAGGLPYIITIYIYNVRNYFSQINFSKNFMI